MNYGLGPGLNFLGRILQLRFAHDVVAIENGIRLVAGSFSRCLLRYAAAKIMEQQSRQSRCLITSAFQAPRKSRTGSPFLVRRESSGCFPLRSSVTSTRHSSASRILQASHRQNQWTFTRKLF